jgi:hypothetical protein
MSRRGTEFIEQWLKDNFVAQTPNDQRFDRRPSEWAERCVSAAADAGISKEEIEEDFGDLEEFMERAITDIADEKAYRKEHRVTKKMQPRPKGEKRPADEQQKAKAISRREKGRT